MATQPSRAPWWFPAAFALAILLQSHARAQFTTVVFQDDFSSNTIDPAKYQADAPFFEGGVGDIHAQAGGGVMKFVGTTSQQWWSGGTLRVVPVFDASEAAPVSVSVDRVAEAGVGTASRSALWVLDETRTKYVLFADVRAEGGWRFNRKIGEDGDVPTGSGTDIGPFNGGTFDDGGLHRMKVVANGKTVKLYLDDIAGPEVKFPFSKVIVEFGSYARANNDTADTTWDNLKIEITQAPTVVFSDDFSSGTINAAKFQPDAPFFEGGTGDIHAEAGNGVLKFVGTTSQQWWSGGTLRVVPTFKASEATPVVFSVDRVAEAGVGTASRSALWILNETKDKYVLFADVRGEGGWRFNRKIGEDGDVPTGSGTDIAAFNGGTFDNGALHRMKVVANGKTLKLYVDDILGTEVKFPFSPVQFQLGAYARANNDTADTTWDNVKVETIVPKRNIVFSDDFAADTIDPARYQSDAPFFEGGQGDIHAVAGGGLMKFVGTTSQQWWSGGTLRIVPTFTASEAETVTLTIDRVAEAGVGTASRSALWILDQTRTKYVLFADVRAEGGWRFNRKIGEDGDVPTGSGTDIAAFNGGTFDNGAFHQMSMVADGKTVKLFLDGIPGAEVKFPFSPVIFEFGSYARANNDTADTTWDNLVIETTGSATFVPTATSVRIGQLSPEITVRIPNGLNSQRAVQVSVVSSDPAVAGPEGGTGGALTLNYPAGGPNTASFKARGLALGGTEFTIQGSAIAGGNKLAVAVISGPGVQLEDSFAGNTLDATKWTTTRNGFETGTGTFTVTQTAGALEISGNTTEGFWPGATVKSIKSFTATAELNLVVDVDRVLLEQAGTAGRTGVYLTTGDRSRYVFFGQNVGENNWQVNVNPGNPTGGGTTLTAFAGTTDTDKHRLRMVANGTSVEVFLDGASGGRFDFPVSSGIFVELGAFARATDDTVRGVFDNAKVEYVLPCIRTSPDNITLTAADPGQDVVVTIPQLLNDAAPVAVTVTSRNPATAIASGAVNGVLTLTFAAGAPNTQTIRIVPLSIGSATLEIASNPGACVSGNIKVDVVAAPETLLADDFSGAAIDTARWRQDETPFDSGTFTADSAISVSNGQARIAVTAESATWPGLALYTVKTFNAASATPVTFEIDRTQLDFVLVTGTGANQRTGIWVRDANGNYVFFSDNVAHDGRNLGWRYNLLTGGASDNPTDAGVNIAAFDGGSFDDQKKHRMKLVVNGATAKLFLDNVLGAEVPFPFGSNLSFGFGAYVAAANDVVLGFFDNALVSGGSRPVPGRLSIAIQGSNLVVEWTGAGTLQETASLTPPVSWTNVTPAPAGKALTVPAGQAGPRYFRTISP